MLVSSNFKDQSDKNHSTHQSKTNSSERQLSHTVAKKPYNYYWIRYAQRDLVPTDFFHSAPISIQSPHESLRFSIGCRFVRQLVAQHTRNFWKRRSLKCKTDNACEQQIKRQSMTIHLITDHFFFSVVVYVSLGCCINCFFCLFRCYFFILSPFPHSQK